MNTTNPFIRQLEKLEKKYGGDYYELLNARSLPPTDYSSYEERSEFQRVNRVLTAMSIAAKCAVAYEMGKQTFSS